MASLFSIENAIVQRLKAQLSGLGCQVHPFPDRGAEAMGRPTGKGQIYVAFEREALEEPNGNQRGFVQSRTLTFGLLIRTADLRSTAGAYTLLDAAREALGGFIPIPGGKPLYQVSGGFVDVREGIWSYAQQYSMQAPYLNGD